MPYAPPARRLPPALLPKVEATIAEMKKNGVIEEIHTPTDFCAPAVVVYKKSGDIRLCADFRQLNRFIKREQFQTPTFEELAVRMKSPRFFSKLDCRNGFWAIPVAEHSQNLLSFSTPFGRFRYRRVPFGISSAPEVFTKVMTSLLSGLNNVMAYVDDVILWAETIQEHDKLLTEVLQRIDDAGLALNREKCIFASSSVEFLGYEWSTEGIRPSKAKLQGLRDMPLPSDKQSLRSFLGLAAYLGQSNVPHFSSLAKPLYELASSGEASEFLWTSQGRKAFSELRHTLCAMGARAYFDPNKKVVVQTDASACGVGAVVLQDNKPIIFGSRALTPTENRYSQIEREFLAIVFALKRFEYLLIGSKFELQTDNLPITKLFRKRIDALSNRLQRWMIAIQHFQFEVTHLRGSKNLVADALSRNSSQADPCDEESS